MTHYTQRRHGDHLHVSRHLLLVPAQVIHSVPMCLQSMGGSPPVNCEKAYSTPKIRIVFGDFILSVSSMFQGLCQQRDCHGDRGAGGGGERGHGDQRHTAPLPEVRPGNKHKNIPLCAKLSRLNKSPVCIEVAEI